METKTMEENVKTMETSAKEVKMNQDAEQKLTYEQLNDACQQLFQQNQRLIQRLKENNIEVMFKRLDYLFKVLEHSALFSDPYFVSACADEIKDAITVKGESKEDTENSETTGK